MNIKSRNFILQLLLIFILAISINYMMGYKFKADRTFVLFTFICILINTNLGKNIIFGIAIIAALFFPTSWYYGQPNLTIMSAILETNMDEATEFLFDLPVIAIISSILYIAIVYFFIYKNKTPINTNNHNIFIAMFILLFFLKPIEYYIKDKSHGFINDIRFTPIEFIYDFYAAYHAYQDENEKIKKQVHQKPNWNLISSNQKYKNYILVIGESVRKDYLHSYGFPLQSTPFMSSAPGTLWNGLIAPGPNTYTSVVRLLSNNNGIDVELNKNIISLANASGIETYWLSNQGKIGPVDTVISTIAYYANNVFFLKKGSYQDVDTADSDLLPHLKDILNKKTAAPKLIVLHLMGSHQNFCQRAGDNIRFDYVNKKISCYLTSIYNTDALLQEINNIARHSGNNFSMLYLADHGLGHPNHKKNNLKHNPDVKQAYDIPLFMISSDDVTRSYIERQRSGMHFIHFLSEWIGVKSSQLNNNYDFFHAGDDIDIKVNTGSGKLVNYSTLRNDPV
ncbi:phosphoethanolamine transferase [Photobacterium nomapromontoriensis]|uniref:phosphoethanolamine transferase n=1 Tax=Photobacterium nomapromontoriensis TaxID=2910237 RepID=UPI003D0BBABE